MFNSPDKDSSTIHLKDAACEMGDNLHEVAHSAGRKVRGMFNTASDEICSARESVGAEIRSNPIRSSLIALGAGVLLGALLNR